ncbi:hypothetical protein L596_018457 [Steinernema carpocapsae]|uniref:G-protein coupled receptors family 1 profile domain-containing protein n=1 Tax=Steinernema carpocapsae TaxID=34508 RepID=A0A4U5N513_STECR|nr:hypothetical protein L596_018457 [Steinernema carpocapsae]
MRSLSPDSQRILVPLSNHASPRFAPLGHLLREPLRHSYHHWPHRQHDRHHRDQRRSQNAQICDEYVAAQLGRGGRVELVHDDGGVDESDHSRSPRVDFARLPVSRCKIFRMCLSLRLDSDAVDRLRREIHRDRIPDPRSASLLPQQHPLYRRPHVALRVHLRAPLRAAQREIGEIRHLPQLFYGTTFWMNYKWAELFIFYLGPFFMFIVLYSKVSCVLWAKNRQLYEGVSNTASEVTQRSEALATRRNVVKMLVACVCVYFICYSPIQGIFLSKVLFNVSVHPPYEFILLMNALAMTCSACNPLLYTLFSKRFRARMAKLILCRAEGASANPRKEMTNSFTKVPSTFRNRCGSTWSYVQGALIIGRGSTSSGDEKK